MANQTMTRRGFLKLAGVGALSSLALGLGGWQYVTQIEPAWVEFTRVELALPRLSPAFDGLRVAQLSDIHLGGWMNRRQLESVVQQVLALEPDVIALTGDYLHGHHWHPEHARHLDDLTAALHPLSSVGQVFAILGNHDHWVSPSGARAMLSKIGAVDLSNTVHTLQRGEEQLHIAGVDSAYEDLDEFPRVLSQLPETGAALLLAHEPDLADTASETRRFDLQMSGHSHGGQVVLPWYGPPVLPWLGKKYPSGLYRVGGMHLYTNRGLGTGGINVRFNCRPEVTLFTLRANEG